MTIKLSNSSFSAKQSVGLLLIFLMTSVGLLFGAEIKQLQPEAYQQLPAIVGSPNGTLPVKKVFAHYMVCCSTAGGEATVNDFKQEIVEAKKRGLDGFALNCGGWEKGDYRNRVIQMYEAARQLGNDFKLFISMDYCCGNGLQDTQDAIERFKNHPNQFRHNGKPVLSTFGGESRNPQTGQEKIALVKGLGSIFVPYFFPASYREHPTPDDIAQLSNDYADLDGYFYFGGAGDGKSIVRSNSLHAHYWLPRGKIFMLESAPIIAPLVASMKPKASKVWRKSGRVQFRIMLVGFRL
jgi:hypothetical protein